MDTFNNPVSDSVTVDGGSDPTDEDKAESPNIIYPRSFAIARAITPNTACVRLLQATGLAFAFGWPVSRHLGAHAEDSNTELAWTTDFCYCVGVSLWVLATAGPLRRAVASGGGLEKLGMPPDASVSVDEVGRRTLQRWKYVLAGLSGLFTLVGLIMVQIILFKVGTVSTITGRVLTPLYVATVTAPGIPFMLVFMPLVFFNWTFALQVASVLAGTAVDDVCRAAARLHPSDAEWQTQVVGGAMSLAHVTLPDLSDTFGDPLGHCTFGWWVFGLGHFAGYLEDRAPMTALFVCLGAFMPFALASTISTTSDKCDTLRDLINKKRGNELSLGSISSDTALQLAELEKYLQNLNRGQGLGFVMFGIVIDKAMMNRIFFALVSFLVTVVPIILALHQPANPETRAVGASGCNLNAAQEVGLQALSLMNTSCTYNVTFGAGGVIAW
eukprot:COSAG05_NODE_3406_length_2084_cov_1.447859_1_plen_442_part_00